MQVENLSTGGAQVTGTPSVASGTSATLEIDQLRIAGTVLAATETGTVNLRFASGVLTEKAITALVASPPRRAA